MLNSCCGCLRLDTAGITIGSLNAVYSTVKIIIIVIYFDVVMRKLEGSIYKSAIIIGYVVLLLVVTSLITSILLVVGTFKSRQLLILPWLINSAISTIFGCIVYSLAMIQIETMDNSNMGRGLILLAINIAFQFYIWYVIYSLHGQIKAERKQMLKQLEQLEREQELFFPTNSSYPTCPSEVQLSVI